MTKAKLHEGKTEGEVRKIGKNKQTRNKNSLFMLCNDDVDPVGSGCIWIQRNKIKGKAELYQKMFGIFFFRK